jgi:hypothetical protein
MHNGCKEQSMTVGTNSQEKDNILYFQSLIFTRQLPAAISENRISSNKEKSSNIKKNGNIYSFSNQSGVKFDSLLQRKITFSFSIKLQLDFSKE